MIELRGSNTDLRSTIEMMEAQHRLLKESLNEKSASEASLRQQRRSLQSKVSSLENILHSLNEKIKRLESDYDQQAFALDLLKKDNEHLVEKIYYKSAQLSNVTEMATRDDNLEQRVIQLIQ